jgi:hypothetical protein
MQHDKENIKKNPKAATIPGKPFFFNTARLSMSHKGSR